MSIFISLKFTLRFSLLFVVAFITTKAHAQAVNNDSLRSWKIKQQEMARQIDSLRILESGYDNDQVLLHNQLMAAGYQLNQRAEKLLINRVFTLNVLTGKSNDQLSDTLQTVMDHIRYASSFIHEQFDKNLMTIDSCMQVQRLLNWKIDQAIKH